MRSDIKWTALNFLCPQSKPKENKENFSQVWILDRLVACIKAGKPGHGFPVWNLVLGQVNKKPQARTTILASTGRSLPRENMLRVNMKHKSSESQVQVSDLLLAVNPSLNFLVYSAVNQKFRFHRKSNNISWIHCHTQESFVFSCLLPTSSSSKTSKRTCSSNQSALSQQIEDNERERMKEALINLFIVSI